MNKRIVVSLLAVLASWCSMALAVDAPSRGTLVFDVKPFQSEVELKPKVEQQLKSGGFDWGVANGRMVISLLNKRFVKFELPNFTRYGESKTLDLDAGTYSVTCIGFLPEGGFSMEKALSKGAFFNVDVLKFEIKAGETTTLEVLPAITKESSFFVKFFLPRLLVRVAGSPDPGVVINTRTDQSVAWDDYQGDLKF
jgi:hypothetical protein